MKPVSCFDECGRNIWEVGVTCLNPQHTVKPAAIHRQSVMVVVVAIETICMYCQFNQKTKTTKERIEVGTGMSDEENVQTIIIKSHSSISKIVTKCITILTANTVDPTALPAIKLIADSKVAGKSITITEIVKRRITEHGKTVNQITQVREKALETEIPVNDEGRKHFQGEGTVKEEKKVDAQIVIRLERCENPDV